MTTNPPFTRRPGDPPLHLRPWTAQEREQHRRLIAKQERCHRRSDNGTRLVAH